MLHHGTLIMAISFIFSTLSQGYSWWGNGDRLKKFSWAISTLAGILSFLLLLDPFIINGMFFDLSSTPILFIGYLLGWKYGMISAALPTCYRLLIGGTGTAVGVVMGTIMPLVIGALAREIVKSKIEPYQVVSFKNLLVSNLVLSFLKAIVFLYMLGLSMQEWKMINVNTMIFSSISLWGIVLMFNDFTKNSISQKELRESEARFKQLVSLIPDGLSITYNSEYVFANNNLADILGKRSPEELIGKRIGDFFTVGEEYNELITNREKQARSGQVAPFLARQIRRHDGEILNVEVAAAPFVEKDEKYILSIVRDTTAQKKADILKRKLEETEALDKFKTEFFSNISHELKTPLNIILGTIQLANVSYDDAFGYQHFHKHMGIMKQNCFRLLRLINNLIDITRLESGSLAIQLRNYDIVKVVEDITISVAKYIENYGIELIFDTEVEEKCLSCDADQMERIMLNLLSNAIKFTKPGGSIMVNMLDQGESIMISVKDTGIGIPPEKLKTIFNRFQQVESTLKMNAGGSGIGLSLVKSLVEAQEGTITVKSELNKGSEFMITLPVKLGEAVELAYDEVAATDQSKMVERITIEFSDINS